MVELSTLFLPQFVWFSSRVVPFFPYRHLLELWNECFVWFGSISLFSHRLFATSPLSLSSSSSSFQRKKCFVIKQNKDQDPWLWTSYTFNSPLTQLSCCWLFFCNISTALLLIMMFQAHQPEIDAIQVDYVCVFCLFFHFLRIATNLLSYLFVLLLFYFCCMYHISHDRRSDRFLTSLLTNGQFFFQVLVIILAELRMTQHIFRTSLRWCAAFFSFLMGSLLWPPMLFLDISYCTVCKIMASH